MAAALEIVDVGMLAYQPAWDLQLKLHEQVSSGQRAAGVLMLVEHPPVVTVGRHPGSREHLLVSPEELAARGVELVETDRGGDITYHGPGQLVAYPIIPLNTYHLNLHAYMRLLEEAVLQTIAEWGIAGQRIPNVTGVWIPQATPADPVPGQPSACCVPETMAKICAMGVKIRRWITLHGLALNVTTDLTMFDLINACGLGRPATSLQALLGAQCPSMKEVKAALAEKFLEMLTERSHPALPTPTPR